MGGDFAMYIMQAKALLNGTTTDLYFQNKYFMDNSDALIGPYLYPEGFPALLAIIYKYLGLNFIAMKVVCSLFLSGTIILLYVMFRHAFKNRIYLFCFLSLVSFHYYLFSFSNNILADLPFLFVSILCLSFMQKSYTPHITLLPLGLIAAALLKSAGIILTVLYFLICLKDRPGKKKWLPLFIAVSFLFIQKIFYINGEANHLEWFKRMNLHGIAGNLLYYGKQLCYVFCSKAYLFPLSLLGLGIAVYGIIKAKDHILLVIYIFLNMAVCIAWPGKQGLRLIMPVIPFLLFFFVKGIKAVPNKKAALVSLGAFFAVVLVQDIEAIIKIRQNDTNECFNTEAKQLYAYIGQNTSTKDSFIFLDPRVLYFFTGRISVQKNNEKEMLSCKPRYILDFKDAERHNPKLKKVFSSKNYTLYKVNE